MNQFLVLDQTKVDALKAALADRQLNEIYTKGA